jgi:hypothetical protein
MDLDILLVLSRILPLGIGLIRGMSDWGDRLSGLCGLGSICQSDARLQHRTRTGSRTHGQSTADPEGVTDILQFPRAALESPNLPLCKPTYSLILVKSSSRS